MKYFKKSLSFKLSIHVIGTYESYHKFIEVLVWTWPQDPDAYLHRKPYTNLPSPVI